MAETIFLRVGESPKLSARIDKPPGITARVKTGGAAAYTLPPATTETLGGVKIGDALTISEDGVLSVVRANSPEKDNTLPITAAAVYTEIGNIAVLLSTI